MRATRFDYHPAPSQIFGVVRRPLVSLECYSRRAGRWVVLTDLLADTGADLSVLPRHVGANLFGDIRAGKPMQLHGIAPGAGVQTFVHLLRSRCNGHEFSMPVAIAETNEVPPLLGRVRGLDRFITGFAKGRHLELSL